MKGNSADTGEPEPRFLKEAFKSERPNNQVENCGPNEKCNKASLRLFLQLINQASERSYGELKALFGGWIKNTGHESTLKDGNLQQTEQARFNSRTDAVRLNQVTR